MCFRTAEAVKESLSALSSLRIITNLGLFFWEREREREINIKLATAVYSKFQTEYIKSHISNFSTPLMYKLSTVLCDPSKRIWESEVYSEVFHAHIASAVHLGSHVGSLGAVCVLLVPEWCKKHSLEAACEWIHIRSLQNIQIKPCITTLTWCANVMMNGNDTSI